MDLVDAISRTNGLSIWKNSDGTWQVSTKNRDGSFACHSGPLGETLQTALSRAESGPPTAPPRLKVRRKAEDDWMDLI